MSGPSGEPLTALPIAPYSTALEVYAVDPTQPPGSRSVRVNASALVDAAAAAAAAAAPPAAAGVPAATASNTVTGLSATALLLLVDGGVPEFIAPADLVTALGNRATDPAVRVAGALAGGDRLFVDQGGSAAAVATLATLLAYLQANLAAIYPTITLGAPPAPAAGAGYTLTGTLAHYAAAPTLAVAIDGGPANPVPGGSTVTTASFSLPMPSLPSGTHSAVVTDSRGTQSAPVTVNVALPPEALTLAAPTGTVYAGSDFVLSGTYAYTSLTALEQSLDGGTTYTPATGAVINAGGTFTVPLNIASQNPAQVVRVRDRDNPAATAATNAFAVAAAVPPSISVATPTGWTAGAAETLTGTYAGPPPTGVAVAIDGGAYAVAPGFTASGGAWSVPYTAPAAGAHTLAVQETNNTSVTAATTSFAVGGAAVGPALAMTAPVYAPGRFGAALSSGSGTATLTMAANGDRTYECRFNAAAPPADGNGRVVFYESTEQSGLWITNTGAAGVFVNGNTQPSSIAVCDGPVHHLALTLHPGGTYGTHPPGYALYVDGVQAMTDNFPASANANTAPRFIVAAAGTATVPTPIGGLAGFGTIDEAAVFSSIKYPAAFTPPTAPYTSSTPGLAAAWHLDNSGASA